MTWKITKLANPKLKKPILISGLPGVGNVGKIALDFMVDKLKAKKFMEIHSYSFPHCVFINENNIVELPTIEFFYKNFKDRSLILLGGDVQPLDEKACYEFCDTVLDVFKTYKGEEIITLGGIALEKIPKNPTVFCTGTDQKTIKKYQLNSKNANELVGPIIGVSGLLTGLAKRRKIPAVTLLAESFGHPNYLGIKGAKELLNLLNKKLNLKIDINSLNSEIEEIEEEIKDKLTKTKVISKKHETSYIG